MFVSIHSMTSDSNSGRKHKIEPNVFNMEIDQEKVKITAKEFKVSNSGERGGSYLETHRNLSIELTKSEIVKISQFAIDNNLIKLCVG